MSWLTPDAVLDGVEAAGFPVTGELTQLNSYENRVYEIRLEKGFELEKIVAKYYRPGRWSEHALKSEHDFLFELKDLGLPVVAPLLQKNGTSLSKFNEIFLGVFPKAYGRAPQELNDSEFKRIGRAIAQLHNIGEQKPAKHRPNLDVDNYGYKSLAVLEDWIAPEVRARYHRAAVTVLKHLEVHLDVSRFIRIHGDCHKGNLLFRDYADGKSDLFFVDFDDFCNGPPAQDFWMLFSGDADTFSSELESLKGGYEDLREWDESQEKLFAPLRALRIIYYAAWIARRWEDPSFPLLFPQFTTYSYWAEETEALEKIAWSLDQ